MVLGLSQPQKIAQEVRVSLTLINWPPAPSTTDVGQPQQEKWLAQFWNANGDNPNQMREEDLPATVQWTNQSSNRLKVNWDEAINFQEKITGIGVVIRDNLGRVFLAQSKTILAIYELDTAEAIAVLHATELCCDSSV